MKTGTHVKIKNNTVKDYRFFTSNRTGIITHISSSKLYTVKMDFNTELAIQTTAENLITIPNNVFTEWFGKANPDVIILGRHTKPYINLIINDSFLNSLPKNVINDIIQTTRYDNRQIMKNTIVSIFIIDNINNNAIETIADILSEYDILLLSGNQYSLRDLT